MRLLNCSTFEIESGFSDVDLTDAKSQLWHTNAQASRPKPKYSILSHRWVGEEINFRSYGSLSRDILRNIPDTNPITPSSEGLSIEANDSAASVYKVAGACRHVRSPASQQAQPLNYIWADTVCINKDDADELRVAINSMFKWYAAAEVCYVYLYDVTWNGSLDSVQQFRSSLWFRRGWTLQELLAPRNVQFFDRDWRYIGTKVDLASVITEATGISSEHLLGDFRTASLGQKMSWLATRDTQRIEDRAYCMLGIFNVYLDPRYGQGEREFLRLQTEMFRTWSNQVPFDETLFAWKADQVESSGLFAPAPLCFKDTGNLIYDRGLAKPRKISTAPMSRTATSLQGMGLSLSAEDQINLITFWSSPVPFWLLFITLGIPWWFIGLPKQAYERVRSSRNVKLNCWKKRQDGSFQMLEIRVKQSPDKTWARVECGKVYESSSSQIYPSKLVAMPQPILLTIPNDVRYKF